MERLATRLAQLGLPMQPDALARAEALLRHYGYPLEKLDHVSDVWLMTVCVEAYRRPDSGGMPVVA